MLILSSPCNCAFRSALELKLQIHVASLNYICFKTGFKSGSRFSQKIEMLRIEVYIAVITEGKKQPPVSHPDSL